MQETGTKALELSEIRFGQHRALASESLHSLSHTEKASLHCVLGQMT